MKDGKVINFMPFEFYLYRVSSYFLKMNLSSYQLYYTFMIIGNYF